MSKEIKIWQLSQGRLIPVQETQLAAAYEEKDLESWIVGDPAILGRDLLVINRQLSIPDVGILDLLCIDAAGKLVIVELKRDRTPRQAVAQALDYASWLDGSTEKDILDHAEQYLGKPLKEAFEEHFGGNLPEIVCQNHRIVLAAPRLDAAADRIIQYLANRYKMDVNAVFFRYAKLSTGEEILARSVLVDEEVARGGASGKKFTLAELLKMADDRKVRPLVDICRQMRSVWDEGAAAAAGGSIMYSLQTPQGWRSLFAINVSGERMKTPVGQLDVWIVIKNVAELSSTDETAIRSTLARDYPQVNEGQEKWFARVSTSAQAEALVQQLKEWASRKAQAAAG